MPVLVMSDPEMLKEVFVKQFSSFHARKVRGDVIERVNE